MGRAGAGSDDGLSGSLARVGWAGVPGQRQGEAARPKSWVWEKAPHFLVSWVWGRVERGEQGSGGRRRGWQEGRATVLRTECAGPGSLDSPEATSTVLMRSVGSALAEAIIPRRGYGLRQTSIYQGLPWRSSGEDLALQCWGCGFNLWSGS